VFHNESSENKCAFVSRLVSLNRIFNYKTACKISLTVGFTIVLRDGRSWSDLGRRKDEDIKYVKVIHEDEFQMKKC
jgi:hypothetical protein